MINIQTTRMPIQQVTQGCALPSAQNYYVTTSPRNGTICASPRQAIMLTNKPVFTLQEWNVLATQCSLPARQKEIAFLLMSGCSDKQIVRVLGITMPTVRTHIGRLLQRLGVKDRHEAMLSLFVKFWLTRSSVRENKAV